jgi:hypothetical protein
MPRPSQLATVPTEALVEELKKRFTAIERAKTLLFGSPRVSSTRSIASGREHVPSKRTRGGTSEYARKVSKLVQTIRHAKGRREDVSKLEKQLEKLRAAHKP